MFEYISSSDIFIGSQSWYDLHFERLTLPDDLSTSVNSTWVLGMNITSPNENEMISAISSDAQT